MSSWFERIINYSRRFMQLVEHSGSIGWKVHELAWSLHEVCRSVKSSHRRSMSHLENSKRHYEQYAGTFIEEYIPYTHCSL
jgi:hypothetical protein